MKILTWNINGVRAVQKDKTNLKKILDSLGADVVCLQETKVTRDMLDEPTAIVDGYESYFSFSKKKSGYSGTANYCKIWTLPVKAEEGLTGKLTTPNDSCVYHYGNTKSFSDEELYALDEEGRGVITQHIIRLPSGEEKEVAIINVYVPRAGDREDRHKYKLQFLTLLQIRAEALLKNGIHVIILGDINTCHRQIDNCDPDEEYFRKSSRIWLNRLLQQKERDKNIPLTDANLSESSTSGEFEDGHFSDVFRQLHPLQENAFTNWCTLTGARQTNFGRRLDYILIDTELAQFATHCEILSDVEGSDHCPVVVTLDCSPIPALQSPLLCSKFMPEFKGQQKKLSSFFSKVAKPAQAPEKVKEPDTVTDNQHNHINSEDHFQSLTDKNKNIINKTQSVSGSKRQLSVEADKRPSSNKKTKLKKGNSSSDSKQISLTSFFSQRTGNSSSNQSQSIQTKNNSRSRSCVSENISNVSSLRKIHESGDDCCVIEDDSNLVDQSPQNKSQLSHPSLSQEEKTLNCDGNRSDRDTSVPIPIPLENEDETDVKRNSSSFFNNGIYQSQSNSSPVKSSQNNKTQKPSAVSAWKGLLGGLPPPPLCPGHKEPSVLRTVKKAGPNQNKQFYVCARPDGAAGNPQSRCDFFQWLGKKK